MTQPKALNRIRDSLVRSSQVGKLKLDATFLRRERDRLVQRLGEAALALLSAGELPEHPGLADALLEIQSVDRRLAESLAQIDAIHREAEAHERDAPPGRPPGA